MEAIATQRFALFHRQRSYEIAYSVRPGKGQTLLYLHGLGSTKEDFLGARSIPALSECTLVGFDFPACGESSSYYPEVALGIDDLVAATHAIVTELELTEVVLIGQSLGGLTGLQFAVRYPELVSHFVNVEGNLSPEDCDIQSRDVFRLRFLGDEEAFFETVGKKLNDPTKPGFEDFAKTVRKNISDRAYFDYSRSIVDYSDNYPLLQQFIDLRCPKMFIHGEANSFLPHIPKLKEAGVPAVSVPDSDHFPALTNPTFYYDSIWRFVSGAAQ